MPANLWKSLTVRFISLGHSLHEAECKVAVIVIDCLMMYTIMGYRFGDAEREGSPVFSLRPKTCSMTLPGNCGTVPEGVYRDGILLPCQLDPARPDSRRELNEIQDERRISSAFTGTSAMTFSIRTFRGLTRNSTASRRRSTRQPLTFPGNAKTLCLPLFTNSTGKTMNSVRAGSTASPLNGFRIPRL